MMNFITMSVKWSIVFTFSFLVFSNFSIENSYANEKYSILLIETMPVKAVLESSRYFTKELAELGYVEGSNLTLTTINLNGDKKAATTTIKKLLQTTKPDLVVTNATLASQTTHKLLKGTDIPQLFFTVGAPVKAGLVQNIGVPTGTNITGRVKMLPSKIRQTIVTRLLTQHNKIAPANIGYIYPSYSSAIGDLQHLMEDSEHLNFVPLMIDYKNVPEGTAQMLKDTTQGVVDLENKVDFWWESAGPLGEMQDYTKSILENSQKPIVYGHRLDSVKLGALVGLVVSLEANGRETARLADAILKGTPPGDIPVEPVSSFHLGINITTALELGVVVPSDILELAGKHVFK